MNCLALRKQLLDPDQVDLGRLVWLGVVDDQSILENAHQCVLTSPEILRVSDVGDSEHLDFFGCGIKNENSMLSLELGGEEEEFGRVGDEPRWRERIVVAVKTSEFYFIGRVSWRSRNHGFRGSLSFQTLWPGHCFELIVCCVTQELLVSTHVSKLCEISGKARLHGHIL